MGHNPSQPLHRDHRTKSPADLTIIRHIPAHPQGPLHGKSRRLGPTSSHIAAPPPGPLHGSLWKLTPASSDLPLTNVSLDYSVTVREAIVTTCLTHTENSTSRSTSTCEANNTPDKTLKVFYVQFPRGSQRYVFFRFLHSYVIASNAFLFFRPYHFVTR